MAEGIRNIGVIGSGVMGAAIAAHLAGAGLQVDLFDIVPPKLEGDALKDPNARNAIVAGGLKRALKAQPAAFFSADAHRQIRIGNLDDHLERFRACDLVIEAVPENLGIKKALFAKIAPYLGEAAVLASNTSGLSISDMSAALPMDLAERFVVLHFFNPVRYMRLVEVVSGPSTDPELLTRMVRFAEFLGKGVVFGKDTTNFVANRIGVHSVMVIMAEMIRRGLTVEQVDALVGKPLARPKTGAFKLCDIVGIDTMTAVAKNCYDSLTGDSDRDLFQMPAFVHSLLKKGNLGRKSGAGFYTRVGKKVSVLDLASGEYREPREVSYESLDSLRGVRGPGARVAQMLKGRDEGAMFAWAVLAPSLIYSAGLVGEIADDIVNIDRAMKWGFNWELGPFEVWDALGVEETCARMERDGLSVPPWVKQMLGSGRSRFYEEDGDNQSFYSPAAQKSEAVPVHPKGLTIGACRKKKSALVRQNAGADLVDLGDGVLGLALHTKMNTVDRDVIEMVDWAVELAEGTFEALVVANDSEHFSAGANLMMIAGAAQAGKWTEIESIIASLQAALQRLKYCSVPVVSAPSQYTLGGGAELAMASDASQAHAESYMGLVEVGVGLIPAGCGCLRMVERYTSHLVDIDGVDLLPHIAAASLNISMAKVSTSAEDAKGLRYLRATDGISLNREFLIHEAKQRALGLAHAGYRIPFRPRLKAAGHDAAATISAKVWGMVEGRWASPHDALIANKVAHVLCGGVVAPGTLLEESHYLDLEREAFLQLCGEQKTQARIEHMLKTGKALRN